MGLRQTEPTEVRIGDNTFIITKFPALKAANLTGELLSVVAPLITVVLPFLKDDQASFLDVDVKELAVAISTCKELDGDQIEKMVTKLLTTGNITVQDDKGNTERLSRDLCDEIFCGEIIEMFMLCIEVVRLNFASFFKKLALPSGIRKEAEMASQTSVDTEPLIANSSMSWS